MNRAALFLVVFGSVALFVVLINWTLVDSWRSESLRLEQITQENLRLNTELRQLTPKTKRTEDEAERCKNKLESAPNVHSCPENNPNSNGINQVERGPYSKVTIFRQRLEEYTKLHKKIMNGELPPRFIQCVLINGWGNILQEAVSCFVFALVTKRAVIFNDGPLGYMPFREYVDYRKMPFDGYKREVLDKYKELVITRHELACLNYNDHKDHEFITIHLTYDYFATNIIVNPYHGEELLEILPKNYFQIIFNYLFQLRDDLQATVDKFKRENFNKFTIGIQIRNPSLDKKGKKDHKGFPVPPWRLFTQAAEQLTRFQEEVPYDQVSWFLATQNLTIINVLRKHYGTKKIISFNGTITTTFEPDREGQKVSLLTWWILGECDEVITTEASSYGTVAAARSGKYPIVCNHDKYCMRRLSQTPCQDTQFLPVQPLDCLKNISRHPHQYLTAPESSCGYYKNAIYSSSFHHSDTWDQYTKT